MSDKIQQDILNELKSINSRLEALEKESYHHQNESFTSGFFDALKSLAFGAFVVGPAIAIVMGLGVLFVHFLNHII
ncbi:hypothetical protein [Falsibacillus albus]|uniref:Uncharacterized protein n=1 Tax=Falsibacillus albus TaxID=2478915 RepID=A0A3L7K495_9BACI|nr:hypothetical protein [Falsibacillus albus]RLQ95542.1 hypothetical protein D9X91_10970 [Falsibacillus albus]